MIIVPISGIVPTFRTTVYSATFEGTSKKLFAVGISTFFDSV